MKTPEEIKKGLECCIKANETLECPRECPYYGEDCNSGALPYQDFSAYTKQLEEENEKLKQVLDRVTDHAAAVEEAAIQAVDRMEKRIPRWIPVEERLPDKMKHVLVFKRRNDHSIYPVAMWHIETDWCGEDGWSKNPYNGYFDITHWMPLPEPPSEKKGE